MGTTHKVKTATTNKTTTSQIIENSFAEGVVYDDAENEWDVVVTGQVEFEAASTNGLPEDFDEGFSEVYVTRVKVLTNGGGHYSKAFESFPPETQKQLTSLLECDGSPLSMNDCDN